MIFQTKLCVIVINYVYFGVLFETWCVQVRPLLELERLKSSEECVRLVSQDQLVLGNDRSFRFDRIFPQDTAQVWGHI